MHQPVTLEEVTSAIQAFKAQLESSSQHPQQCKVCKTYTNDVPCQESRYEACGYNVTTSEPTDEICLQYGSTED